jgi:hypothetical protein
MFPIIKVWQCCGTALFCCGSGSGKGKLPVCGAGNFPVAYIEKNSKILHILMRLRLQQGK